MPQFRLGDQGSAVAEIRSILAGQGLLSTTHGRHAAEADTPGDTFDADTDQAVRAFQQQRGLIVDGIVGPATYRALREASYQLGARVLAFRFSRRWSAMTSHSCRTAYRTSATTPRWSTVSSVRQPTTLSVSIRANTGSSPTESAGPPPCVLSNASVPG